MIKQTTSEDGRLVTTESDMGMMIRQVETGILYDKAIDLSPCRYSYDETDTPIPKPVDLDSYENV